MGLPRENTLRTVVSRSKCTNRFSSTGIFDRGILLRRDISEFGLSRESVSMDWEKGLIEAFETMVHKVFPNPQRIGCPGHDSLLKLASDVRNPEFGPILAHVRQCAPCFDELKQLRNTQCEPPT